MKAGVLSAPAAREFFTPELCWILEVANDEGDERLSVSRARVTPGTTTKWHSLTATDERYLVTSGEGLVEVGDDPPVAVTPGAVVRIPAGQRQRIANTGGTDLVFYCICTPRFVPQCYVALEP